MKKAEAIQENIRRKRRRGLRAKGQLPIFANSWG